MSQILEGDAASREVGMVEDLREQVILEDAEAEEKAPNRGLLGLKPWQRLVLAVFLLFDVALCGCMALVMMGRVMPPF